MNKLKKTKGNALDIFVVFVLGLVQGFTEFLPVSSSGHLVLFENIFGIHDGSLFLNVALHVATLVAVVIFYRKKLWDMVKHPLQPINAYLVCATVVTCVIVVLFSDFFENSFSGGLLAWGFILSAVFLLATEWISKKYEKDTYPRQKIEAKQSLLLGLFQGLAILPGISRSGTTLCAGIVMGVEKKEALDFSFLMSIPIIIASLVYELVKCDFKLDFADVTLTQTLVGCVTAFACAIVGIKLMLKVVEKVQYKWFAIYLLILAGITIIVV